MMRIYFHIVLFVANRARPFDASVDADVQEFVKAVLRYKGLTCVELCILPDHIHLLVESKPEHAILKTIETLQYWLQDFVLRHSNQSGIEWTERFWLVSKSPADIQSMKKLFHKQADYHMHADIDQEWRDLLDWEEIEEELHVSTDQNSSVPDCDNLAFAR